MCSTLEPTKAPLNGMNPPRRRPLSRLGGNGMSDRSSSLISLWLAQTCTLQPTLVCANSQPQRSPSMNASMYTTACQTGRLIRSVLESQTHTFSEEPIPALESLRFHLLMWSVNGRLVNKQTTPR